MDKCPVIIDFDAGPTRRVVAVSVIADLPAQSRGVGLCHPVIPV